MLLKEYYNTALATDLAKRLAGCWPGFEQEDFVCHVSHGVEGKEYSARLQVFAEAFERYLPPYPEALRLFQSLLGPELSSFAVMYEEGAWLAPIGRYVERHAAVEEACYAQTLAFIRELTKRYTGEFAMRPLLQAFPERTLAALLEWSRSGNAYVRRCASECMRVRLPWAKKMTTAVEHAEAYMAVLNALREDENPYVQRSVANNLNDLFKHDAVMAQAIIDRWLQQKPVPAATQAIIRHGTRSLRKAARRRTR